MKSNIKYLFTTDYPKYRQSILDFWEKVEGDSRQVSFDSTYMSNPLGEPLLGLSHDGNKLVGTENYLRQNVCFNGKVYEGAHGVDTLVDPNYRLLRGVFGGLCRITHEKLQQSVDILFAKPNDTSKKYYLNYFDWKITSQVEVHKKVINSKLLSTKMPLSLLKRGKRYADFELRRITFFSDTDIDEVIDKNVLSSKFAYFHKSAAYLDWKFLNPHQYAAVGYLLIQSGKTVGYCVTYDKGTERRVLDLLVEDDSEEVFNKAMSTLITMSRRDGIEVLSIHATESAWYKPILKRLLFLKREAFEFITLPYRTELSQARWSIHQGDFDIF